MRASPARISGLKLDRVLPKMPDAFQDDRAGVADRIEGSPPLGPVDRAVAGRLMRILPAVVVVDVGRRQQTSRRLVFPPRGCGEVGMTGIEGQRELRVVELREQLGQLGHSAAGVNAGRHVLDTDDDTGPPGVLGEFPEPNSPAQPDAPPVARDRTSRRDERPGIYPPPSPANPRTPSDRRPIRDSRTRSLAPRSTRRARIVRTPQAAMGAVNRQPAIGNVSADQSRIG